MTELSRPFPPAGRGRYWAFAGLALLLLVLSAWALGAELSKDLRPGPGETPAPEGQRPQAPALTDATPLQLSQFCIESPEISCMNPACHPQPPSAEARFIPSSIMKEICVSDPDKNCTDSACHFSQRPRTRTLSHPLFFEQKCEYCHVRHDSPLVPVVKAVPEAVCLTCHAGSWWRLLVLKPPHPPGNQSCTVCHNPHQSRFPNLLRNEAQARSCATCHAPFLEAVKTKPYYHRHMEDRVDCSFCHYAHRPGMGDLVRENAMESCLTCHDLPIRFEGRVLENVKKHIAESPVVHGAIREGTCPICHTPHGSDQSALLRDGYPAASHAVFSIDQYALCLQCHPRALLEENPGVGATEFRTAEKNLHLLHLSQIGRGRACHLCHEAHASERPRLLREFIRFKLWNAPFDFTELPDGGRCLTACHREREYRRN